MAPDTSYREQDNARLQKSRTGIQGLDDITNGGLPQGRVTLICGGPGCGKTLFSTEFLVHGALEYGEPGVFLAFEETPVEIAQNIASLGIDLNDLIQRGLLHVDYIHIDPREVIEAGEFDLEGLFLRLKLAIDTIGAKRVVLDTLEALFSGFSNQMILRAELRRLFRWLKDMGITAIVTAERGESTLTRFGLEEYVSDCVILLDHKVTNHVSTRRLRIVKYRGSTHGTNEFPFLIGEDGISILPITSLRLAHTAPLERVPTGIRDLDEMLEGGGYYRGSSILISGTAGTGKTSLAAHFVKASCARGERVIFLAFEESPYQLTRNMRSIGIDLQPWVENGLLRIQASRPSMFGLEMHLVAIHKLVEDFRPSAIVVDPITNLFNSAGDRTDVESILTRLVDYLKLKQITAVFTSLTTPKIPVEQTEAGISSLMDTWLLIRMIEENGERNRGLYVLKSRGMAHSNQVREMIMTNKGIELMDVYLGMEGVVTGTARMVRENRDQVAALHRQQVTDKRKRELERKRTALEAQITLLRAQFAADEDELVQLINEDHAQEALVNASRSDIATRRVDQYHSEEVIKQGDQTNGVK